MTAPAGTPGIDRTVRPEDLTGTVVVSMRGPGHVEILSAPDHVVLRAHIVLELLGAGVASYTVRPDGHHLTIGYAWPISTSGRVVYRLSSDPQAAIGLGGITARIEGTRIA
jgi:hypothetical protein